MDFRKDIRDRILLLDGAMGTNLISRGIRIDTMPDILNLENPEPVKKVIQSYFDAGSDIVRTNTFSTIRPRLRHFGLENRLEEIARSGVSICRSVIKDRRYLAVSIGPTGKLMPPAGDASFDEIYDYYYEIARIYDSEGVDIFWLETFNDIYELKTAAIAVRDVSKKPIVALMTFDKNMRSTFGSTPQISASVLSALEVDAIGANCSLGTLGILNIIAEMRSFTSLPLVAQPNAGLPETKGNMVFYPESPQDMASYTKDFIENGVRIIGACCGSTSDHIARIKEELKELKHKKFNPESQNSLILTSRTSLVEISHNSFPVIVGERINPTNKKYLTDALMNRDYSVFIKEAIMQAESGATVLDINAGISASSEKDLLPEIIKNIQTQIDIPISVDTADDEALESSLKNIAGRGLINSIKDDKSLEKRLEMAKRYGAACIVLTLDERGLPANTLERIRIAEKIMKKAEDYGLNRWDMIFDFLTLSAATSQSQIKNTLDAISEFYKSGLFTILGISNISYGLPVRSYINSAFLSFAINAGLSAAIMDPLDKNMLHTFYAASALKGYDRNFSRYIQYSIKRNKDDKDTVTTEINPLLRLSEAVISGLRKEAVELTAQLLNNKINYNRIIKEGILSAMKEVGVRFKSNQMFLPQVMLSAEAAQAAFDRIMESVKNQQIERKGRIVIATVEGDIHDLGKNLVSAVLRNSGFEVVDLGKNVKAEFIVNVAKERGANIIGLSALMTTTMNRMREVMQLLQESDLKLPVMIGGAVVTESFAKEIGAYYGRDAVEAVSLAEDLIEKKKNEG